MKELEAVKPNGMPLQEVTRSLYIDLVSKCVLDEIYEHKELVPVTPQGLLRGLAIRTLSRRGLQLVREKRVDSQTRLEGRDWPMVTHTMIGRKRVDNLRFCVEDTLNRNVPGDFIEAGVWRGGATILMRAILKAYGISDRKVWVADSFEGLPQPNVTAYPHDEGDVLYQFKELAVSLEEVRANFQRYDLLDDQVLFLKGWFKDTLGTARIDSLAVIRLDGDMYESTIECLNSLYGKLSVGGYIIIDDYNCIPACRQAVADYRQLHGIREDIREVDWTAVYWQKTKP